MKIFYGKAPPNFEAILEVIPDAAKPGIIFAYAPDIYVPNPSKFGGAFSRLPPSLVAHEKVHLAQQGFEGGPPAWWSRYLTDPVFRFDQELLAHRVEYSWWKKHKTIRQAYDALELIATRLASGLYKHPHSFELCKRLIQEQGKNSIRLLECKQN